MDDDIPDDCREALLIRQEAAKTSTAKLKAFLKHASADGRVRGAVTLVVSNKADAGALKRAARAGIVGVTGNRSRAVGRAHRTGDETLAARIRGDEFIADAAGERGGQPDPAIAPLPRYADVMRRVGQMFPKMLGPDDTLLLYDAERNTYAPESMPKPELVEDGGT